MIGGSSRVCSGRRCVVDGVEAVRLTSQVLNDKTRALLVDNIAGHLGQTQKFIQERTVDNFTRVHPDFGDALKKALQHANTKL
jgi:catalase